MDYDLDRLGAREFEHLTQALAMKVLGPGVEAFGDGADGGREATFEGRLNFPIPGPDGPWDGYGVIQAKFHYRPRDTGDNARWLALQLKSELQKWADPSPKRGRRPDYFLAVSNVKLSPYPGTGGIDSINELIAEYQPKLGLKGWHVWHYDQLCRLLDGEYDVASKYFGLIAPGDVLARLDKYVKGRVGQLADSLIAHVAKELLAEQLVRIGQAGDVNDQGLALDKVAVDLPAIIGGGTGESVSVAAYVIAQGNKLLRPRDNSSATRGLVIIGGPGQGKTTLAQLICQTYRVALLEGLPEHLLSDAARSLRDEFRGRLLGEVGLELPAARRWPVHIRLDQYGDAITADGDLTLLRYIAARVSKRAPRTIADADLAEWLKEWPWLLVLDGLDEVADQPTREELMRRIREFEVDAALHDADLLVVVTTRPQGYGGEFDIDRYQSLNLRALDTDEAVHYAERLAAARYGSDPEKQEQIVARVRAAVQQERTARLMRSPLQVTIMSLLLERNQRTPQHRYGLFRAYYETVFAREVGKQTIDAQLLDRHAAQVHALQEAVGMVLQMRSERQGDADAALPLKEFRELAAHLLRQEQYEADQVDALSSKLVTLATHRLVLLVPSSEGGIGFEVRSLQEFMAAKALTSGPETDVLANLAALIPSAHWRNTWLLAAGKLFAARDHLRGELLAQLRAADTVDPLHITVAPGTQLAVDLLDDLIVDTSPKYQRLLVQHAIELLKKTPDLHILRLAEVLAESIAENPAASAVVESAVTDALAFAGPSAVSAMMLCAAWPLGTGTLASSARTWLALARSRLMDLNDESRMATIALAVNYPLGTLRELSSASTRHSEPLNVTTILSPLLDAEKLDAIDRELAEKVMEVLAEADVWLEQANGVWVIRVDRTYVPDLSRLDDPLANPHVTAALVHVADGIGLDYWPIASLLRRVLGVWLERQPVTGLIPVPPVSDHGW
jgi:hypothetical protein